MGFGTAAARLAVRRRRRPRTWAIFGAIIGPAALALLELAPPGRCWSCAAPTQGWLTLCPWCGEDIREPVGDAPVEEVRVRGPLTVIDGSASRALVGETDERRLPRVGSSGRNSAARSTPDSVDGRDVDVSPGERRIELPPRPPFAEPTTQVPPAAHVMFQPAADPVHRLKAMLGGSHQSLAAAQAEPAHAPAAEPRNIVLASAIYVTGSRGLLAGSRYGIALVGDHLRILGPVDVDPAAVAIAHPLRGVDATGLQGRLIITAGERRRERLALVFMSVAGGSAEGVADAIVAAASDLGSEPR